jgi:hypothetical protein
MKVGDKVMKSDVTEKSIPAYRDLRGHIVWLSEDGRRCKVRWGINDKDENSRDITTVKLA